MSDVFVSYKAEDRRRVKPLVEALESEGYDVWWDEQIGGGAAWRHTIETELNAARCVVVAWSRRAVGPEGTFVQDEATRAQQRRVYVPVTIDKVHLPLGFGETQALPLTGWKGDRSDPRYQAVLSAVRRIAGESGGARAAVPKSELDRRAVIAGGAMATVAIAGAGTWALLRPSSADAGADSIAVLPFANLSGDPAQAYFSDGIAEEVRSALTRIPGMEVAGRTSSEAVRDDDAATAAKKLGVASILTGSVRQSPSTIRITAELIDGQTGLDRWSQDYDRSPGDSIKIETDIAEKVAQALSASLGAAGRSLIRAGGTTIPEAQKLVLQAIALRQDGTKGSYQRALPLLDKAIRLDPRYADAYAHKARVLDDYGDFYAVSSSELAAYRSKAMRNAQTALRLAPNLASAHCALAIVLRSQLRLPAALSEYQRALALAPADGDNLQSCAYFFSCLGRPREALRFADKAIALDPLNPSTFMSRLLALKFARRFSNVVAYAHEVVKKFPETDVWPHVGTALVASGKYDEARQVLERAPKDSYLRMEVTAILLARTGQRSKIPAIVARMKQLYGDVLGYQLGEIYSQMGDMDRAFAALDHAWATRDGGLLISKVDIWLDPLRSDPRFAALMAKMNFPA